MDNPGIAVAPWTDEALVEEIEGGGARIVEPGEADGLVWLNPGDPQSLIDLLTTSPARWVQLPFAGIESFFEAGAIDPDRTWTCAKGAYGHACAEHALALMLAAARRIHHHVRNRTWEPGGLGRPEQRLKGKLVVIVGTGGIGQELVPMLAPLGARMIGVNRSGRPLVGAEETVTTPELPVVIGDADFVVLAAAVTEETKGMVDAALIEKMKESAWIVNVARGILIDTDALVDALEGKRIGGAALDVTEPEPLPDGHPLWALENAIITPHVANTWDMAVPDLRALIGRNVKRFVNGEELEGLVDVKAGY
jgi:phosphoglycerate dehydrogenase-like enzyme